MTACVRGRIKFVEKTSADASHKKSLKVVPRRRMAELEEFIQCLSDTKTADTARSLKGSRVADSSERAGSFASCSD